MIRDDSLVIDYAAHTGTQGTWTPPSGHVTETLDQWIEMQENADIDGAPMFYTQPTQQATQVCIDDDEDGYDAAAKTVFGVFTEDAKKKAESHRGTDFTEKEVKCLCDSWLALSNASINGVQQKSN